ncbi:uncharacterized protein LOC107761298 [Nicotiana tabacum]|uniref:Uncharacterized protein LOC107761298 n=1 Tax=Nicotiana tabacum TaxID=4097 RepID=A0AC58TJH3_TOBAC
MGSRFPVSAWVSNGSLFVCYCFASFVTEFVAVLSLYLVLQGLFLAVEVKIELALSESTVDEFEISPNDVVGKVLGKEHPGRVRYLGLGATPSNTFRKTNIRPGNIRIVSNNVGCSSSGCQEKYNQLMNTLKEYMIMKEGSIPEQFAGIFASTPTTPSDAVNVPISPTDERRSSGSCNPSDSH